MVEFDAFGPEKVLEVYNPKVGMRGFVVIDNTALGPGKGGIRMTPSVTIEEVAKLARAMTWKTALAELPFGGAKSGIVADDRKITAEKKKEIIEAFAKALSVVSPGMYVAAPDMNTAEEEMRVYAKVNGLKSVTGKPSDMGGLPHELGSTGWGVFHSAKVALEYMDKDLSGMEVAVEGFGNVGWFAAKFLAEAGAKLVAVSDSKGTIYNSSGIDFEELDKAKREHGTVTRYTPGKVLSSHELIGVSADILVTAAIPNLVQAGDVDRVKARLIVEGSNIPMTADVEDLFHRKGVLVIPDFVANAGGVISSYAEYVGKSEKEMMGLVENKVRKNTGIVLEQAKEHRIKPRDAAMRIATERVLDKCDFCRVELAKA